MEGPDQIIQTENMFTTDSDGYCQIRLDNNDLDDIPPISLVTAIKNICEASNSSKLIAMKVKRDDKWISWTYAKYYNDIKTVSRAFIQLGLESRHSVAICGFNSPEWFLSEIGCIFAGGMVGKSFFLPLKLSSIFS